MKLIFLEKSLRPFNPGEIAGFEDERAEKLVKELRAGRYLTREEREGIAKVERERMKGMTKEQKEARLAQLAEELHDLLKAT